MGSAPLLFLLSLGLHHVRLSAIGPCQVQKAFRNFGIGDRSRPSLGFVGLLSQDIFGWPLFATWNAWVFASACPAKVGTFLTFVPVLAITTVI